MQRSVLISLAAICLVAVSAAQTEWARLAPFTAARVSDKSVVIRVNEREYDLVSINDVSTADLLTYCRSAKRLPFSHHHRRNRIEASGAISSAGPPRFAPPKTRHET
jgi:hypothetical protein